MGKYSNEFKLKVVKYCIEEQHSYGDTAKHFSIPSATTILQWTRTYQKHECTGLFKNLKSSSKKFYKKP
jgi:transposase-like protein